MTLSIDLSPPNTHQLNKDSPLSMAATTTSPLNLISPSSDKQFWSKLRNRVDAILESQNSDLPSSVSSLGDEGSCRIKRMREDSLLLIRGFDSAACSLSQLTSTLDNALQGARDLGKAPTLSEIVHSVTNNAEKIEHDYNPEVDGDGKLSKKRKLDDARDSSPDEGVIDKGTEVEKEEKLRTEKNLTKVKKLAVSMAAKAASLARELKSVKSDSSFLEDRCALLEEENRRLREGYDKEIRPEEDDLVRLQLEALLAEKSRLATENANLTRENQCLRQLVEYHQFTSQDLSASYEQVIQGLGLDFGSPEAIDGNVDPETPRTEGSFELGTNLEESFAEEQELNKD